MELFFLSRASGQPLATLLARTFIKMKNLVLIICAVAGAYFDAAPLRAADPFESASATPTPASINVYDWYTLGELVCAAANFNYNVTVYSQLDGAYKRIYEAMQKVHLSDSTISAFKEYYSQLKKLPFDKEWDAWTKQEQDIWLSSPAGTAWLKGIAQDAGKSMPTTFFYWLGRHTLSAAWVAPYYQSHGWKKDLIAVLTNVSTDCYAFATDSNYHAAFDALAPDVQKELTVMGALAPRLKPKAEDPFASPGATADPISDDDIAKVMAAAKQLRAAAQDHKLLRD
jgi:hypothetical protein